MVKVESTVKDKIQRLPLGPGVYIMLSSKNEVLYIGKASSLRKRVKGHFSSRRDLFLNQIKDIKYIECDSEEQALILEASLIKEKKPRYNISLRDDKSYPFIEITNEKFPRIFISRPREKRKSSIFFGPYPKVKILKSALTLIRRIFPYRSCANLPREECLYFHLKLCPGPCIGKISPLEYRDIVENICKILKGERKKLMRTLENKMRKFSAELKFEEAKAIRDKLLAIYNLYEGRPSAHQLLALKEILNLPSTPLRIEAIDISSLKGEEASGSVVVFRNGFPDKSSYRRFKIKKVQNLDDYAMIREVIERRYSRLLKEKKRLPDLIIIDGGKGQVGIVKEELERLKVNIPVIGIAKKNEEIWFPHYAAPLVIPNDSPALHLIQRVRDEAHRFAHKYHLWQRKKKVIPA